MNDSVSSSRVPFTCIDAGSPCMISDEFPAGQGFFEIELPDGNVVPGRVSDVAAVATQTVNQGVAGDPTTEVTIVFADGEPNEVFDAAPVDVTVTDKVNAGVLTVPVPALIALAGGGHAVELIVDGGTQLIGVQLGDFVDDLVEISGDIQPGDRVVMAGT